MDEKTGTAFVVSAGASHIAIAGVESTKHIAHERIVDNTFFIENLLKDTKFIIVVKVLIYWAINLLYVMSKVLLWLFIFTTVNCNDFK